MSEGEEKKDDPKAGFWCDGCDAQGETIDDALGDCTCLMRGWFCGSCGAPYTEKSDAVECCEEEPDD